MPRRGRRPEDQGDDLFSSDPGSFVAHQLAGRSWPPQERFPVNHARAYVRRVVTGDLRTSDAPLLIAGYSSIAALIELVADWRRIRGDRPGIALTRSDPASSSSIARITFPERRTEAPCSSQYPRTSSVNCSCADPK